MSIIKSAFLSLILLGVVTATQAQTTSISLGPQISGFGIGASASARVGQYVSVSAEFGFLPLSDINSDIDDIDYVLNPEIFGTILGVHFHPGRGNISIGAGIVFGKYLLDSESEELTESVEIGDDEFPASGVGTLVGEFSLEGTWPAVMVGWRGKGFNFGLGIALIEDPKIDLRATGPLGDDPLLRSEIDREMDEIRDELKLGILPLFRFGYQFGLSSN